MRAPVAFQMLEMRIQLYLGTGPRNTRKGKKTKKYGVRKADKKRRGEAWAGKHSERAVAVGLDAAMAR